MNLETCTWNTETYLKFEEYLYSLQDISYQKFHGRLIKDESSLIGIRTPILKEIAKKISKNSPFQFLKQVKHETYEEKIIQGLLLGYLKIDFKELVSLLDNFIPFIDNWAINDITCANLKIWKNHLSDGYPVILTYLKSSNPWEIRFGLVLLLDYYIQDTYIDSILDHITQITHDNYYVKMANAWLVSVCYIYYPKKIIKLLKQQILDSFTQNQAIQKIIDSKRVIDEEKEFIRSLKMNI